MNSKEILSFLQLTVAGLILYLAAAGSMLPKTQAAALQFLAGGINRTAIITSLEKTADAINGTAGTIIKN